MHETLQHQIFTMIGSEMIKMKKQNKKGASQLQLKLQEIDEDKLKLFSKSLYVFSEICVKLGIIQFEISKLDSSDDKKIAENIMLKKVNFSSISNLFDSFVDNLFEDKKVGQDLKIKCMNTKYDFKMFKILPLAVF